MGIETRTKYFRPKVFIIIAEESAENGPVKKTLSLP